MRLDGLAAKRQRSFKRTTRQHAGRLAAPNHLAQQFVVSQPNRVWLADITYVGTQEGWLYLAAVMDLFSRQIIGWSMSKRMTDELSRTALQMAVASDCRRSASLCIILTVEASTQARTTNSSLKGYEIKVSMSGTGNCYDNAPMESFFSLLKTELVHHQRYMTRQEARTSIFDYIEVFYNRQRIHSAIEYKAPVEYESYWWDSACPFEISNGPLGGRYATTTHP